MAKVLRASGKYVSPAAIEKRRKLLAIVLAFTAACFGFSGYIVGNALKKSPLWMDGVAFASLGAMWLVVFVVARGRIEALDQEHVELSGSSEGELAVRKALE